jgi:hypothetical protein
MYVVRCCIRMNQNIQSHNNSSLREEIAKRLWQIGIRDEYGIEEIQDVYEYEYGVHDWRTYTEKDKKQYLEDVDDILKLFEKRLEYIQESKEEFDYEGHYHGDDEFWSGYELGFEKAFEIIKKEML